MSAPAPEASAAAFTLRTARLVDAERIFALIHLHRDRLVPRSLGNIVENIDRFVVAEVDGEMVGCATYGIFPEIGEPLHTVSSLRSTVSCATPPQTIAPTEPEPSGSASSQTFAGESYFSSYAADAVSASAAVERTKAILQSWFLVFMSLLYHFPAQRGITRKCE